MSPLARMLPSVARVVEPLLKYRHDYPTYHMLAEAQNNLDEPPRTRRHPLNSTLRRDLIRTPSDLQPLQSHLKSRRPPWILKRIRIYRVFRLFLAQKG